MSERFEVALSRGERRWHLAFEAGIAASISSGAQGDETTVVSLWLRDARYGSVVTPSMLVSPEAGTFVGAAVHRQLFAWLRDHPREARAIIRHVLRRPRA